MAASYIRLLQNSLMPQLCYPKRLFPTSTNRLGQFAVAALSERRNPLRIQDRRSETAATKIKLTPYQKTGATFLEFHRISRISRSLLLPTLSNLSVVSSVSF